MFKRRKTAEQMAPYPASSAYVEERVSSPENLDISSSEDSFSPAFIPSSSLNTAVPYPEAEEIFSVPSILSVEDYEKKIRQRILTIDQDFDLDGQEIEMLKECYPFHLLAGIGISQKYNLLHINNSLSEGEKRQYIAVEYQQSIFSPEERDSISTGIEKVISRCAKLLKFLLDQEFDINKQNSKGVTFLHLVCKYGLSDFFDILMDIKYKKILNVNLEKTHENKNALDFAIEYKHDKLVEGLLNNFGDKLSPRHSTIGMNYLLDAKKKRKLEAENEVPLPNTQLEKLVPGK